MDLLVMFGALTAFVSGVIGAAAGVQELVLFDAAALIVVFVAIGKYLEARARGAASRALELLAQRLPTTALRISQSAAPGAETLESVPARAVRVGDRLRLTPHAAVPVDGALLTGQMTVDESMLTGESLPVEKRPDDCVFGGTQVLAGQADIRATATGADSAAARIAKLVEQAQTTKPPWQRLADRVAGVFVPAVLALALLTFTGWWLARPGDPFWALQRTIAVLVVACPCAMGLAIPTAVMVGTARAAERGILVRDAESLEAAAEVRTVLLDKTGTLTLGRPRLASVAPADGVDEVKLLLVAGALGQLNPHPLAQALTRAARERGLSLPAVVDFASRPGGGVSGVIEGAEARSGSVEWVREGGAATEALEPRAGALADAGQSVVWVAHGKRLLGVLGLADEVHPESAGAIAELRRLGVVVRILSGDQAGAVASLARRLGVDAYEAQLTPDQKLEHVRRLAGGRGGVAMVGDGVNDAPALAAADVGIAIGTGADVSREAAGICLVGHSPQRIADAIRLSRASARIMRQNLFWAFFYNVIMLPVAIFTPLPPAVATAAMMFSSLSVVGNSLRLRAA
jgi:Cu+-exporting ATPase